MFQTLTCCVYQGRDEEEGEEHKKDCHKFPRAPENTKRWMDNVEAISRDSIYRGNQVLKY